MSGRWKWTMNSVEVRRKFDEIEMNVEWNKCMGDSADQLETRQIHSCAIICHLTYDLLDRSSPWSQHVLCQVTCDLRPWIKSKKLHTTNSLSVPNNINNFRSWSSAQSPVNLFYSQYPWNAFFSTVRVSFGLPYIFRPICFHCFHRKRGKTFVWQWCSEVLWKERGRNTIYWSKDN